MQVYRSLLTVNSSRGSCWRTLRFFDGCTRRKPLFPRQATLFLTDRSSGAVIRFHCAGGDLPHVLDRRAMSKVQPNIVARSRAVILSKFTAEDRRTSFSTFKQEFPFFSQVCGIAAEYDSHFCGERRASGICQCRCFASSARNRRQQEER